MPGSMVSKYIVNCMYVRTALTEAGSVNKIQNDRTTLYYTGLIQILGMLTS